MKCRRRRSEQRSKQYGFSTPQYDQACDGWRRDAMCYIHAAEWYSRAAGRAYDISRSENCGYCVEHSSLLTVSTVAHKKVIFVAVPVVKYLLASRSVPQFFELPMSHGLPAALEHHSAAWIAHCTGGVLRSSDMRSRRKFPGSRTVRSLCSPT